MLERLNSAVLVLAADEGPAHRSDEGGNFLVTPELGLMIWTLLAFGVTLWVLSKYVFPRIQEALDKRQKAIEESIEESERTRAEAQKILEEYRQRLQEARAQAEEIVVRARRRPRSTSASRSRPLASSARSCWSRPGATSRPRPGGRSRRSATRSPT